MGPEPGQRRGRVRGLRAAISMIIVFVAVLTVVLRAARSLELTTSETASWILAAYSLPSLLSLGLALRYKQPLLLTGNLFAIIFVASLGGRFSFQELIGGYVLAGLAVAIISALGLTGWLSRLIPSPVVFGLLAGAITPFISEIFTSLGEAPVTVFSALLAYLASRWILRERLPPVVSALAVGLAVALFRGELTSAIAPFSFPELTLTRPEFSAPALASTVPVLVVLITVQSNLPSLVFLKSQDYRPPDRLIDAASSLGTTLGSILGPMAVSLSLPATALVAGPNNDEPAFRHRAVYAVGLGGILIGLAAPFAAELPRYVPIPLLFALAGLAMVDVFLHALRQATKGPLLLGPAFAFGIALSDISLFGFGPFFWALVLGAAISLTVERGAQAEPGSGEAGGETPE